MNKSKEIKIILSGGGTGGHLFPAIAIADALKDKLPHATFLFVGANRKIEMDKVPKLGYKIKGLPITGFRRDFSFKNLLFPFKLLFSILKSIAIVQSFKPDVAIGTGGFASGPVLKVAEWFNVPTYVQEQNSYPGVTNKLLGKKAKKIFVAFDTLEKFFDSEKLMLTGNPLRKQVSLNGITKEAAAKHFNLNPDLPIVFITGGSLGARMLNRAVLGSQEGWKKEGIQMIWQCGKMYLSEYEQYANDTTRVFGFLDRMDMAYAAADVLVTRAGASTISELALVGKPSILVPSPNVAEDHQTKNVKALVEKNAAVMLRDREAFGVLGKKVIEILEDTKLAERLATQMKTFAKPNAANDIADYIIKELELA